jgi:hypothetical protein
MNDDAELQRELKWRDPDPDGTPGWVPGRPRGANVLFAMQALLWVCGLGLYLRWFGPVDTREGLGSIVACVVTMVFWLWVSNRLGRRLWIAAGPYVRSKLRPYGLFGPFPAMIALVVIIGVIVGLVQRAGQVHSVDEFLRGGPLEGTNWKVLYEGDGDSVRPIAISYQDAQARCATLGPQWHLPRRADRLFLDQQLEAFAFHHSMFHLARDGEDLSQYGYGKALYFLYDDRARDFQITIATMQLAAVVCIR